MLCEKCRKRETCTELCKEALEYVDPERLPDDFVRQVQENPDRWPVVKGSKKYQMACLYFLDGWTEQEVADHFCVTKQYISKLVVRVKEFMKQV